MTSIIPWIPTPDINIVPSTQQPPTSVFCNILKITSQPYYALQLLSFHLQHNFLLRESEEFFTSFLNPLRSCLEPLRSCLEPLRSCLEPLRSCLEPSSLDLDNDLSSNIEDDYKGSVS